MTVTLHINGVEHALPVEDSRSLLDILRNELGLKGSRFGCGQGLCGACMVLVDGHATYACDTPAWSLQGKQVTTIEGIGQDPLGARLQQSFVDCGAAQCGYCTSGMVVSAYALLARCPAPSAQEARTGMDRNLCRCGTHVRVLRAIDATSGGTAEPRS